MNEEARSVTEELLSEQGFHEIDDKCDDCCCKLWLRVDDYVPQSNNSYRTIYSFWCPCCDVEVEYRSERESDCKERINTVGPSPNSN